MGSALTELEELLVWELKEQGADLQDILMIMYHLAEENDQVEFGKFLVSIRGMDVPI